MDAKELIENACKATGLTVDELAERLDYKSLKRAAWGEIPLPASKRKHIADIVRLHELESGWVATKSGALDTVDSGAPRGRLRAALRDRKMSAATLAKKIGYNAGIIENVINGTGRMSEAMAEKIVAVLDHGLTVEDLLSGSDMPPTIDPSGLHGPVGSKPRGVVIEGRRRRRVPKIGYAVAGSLKSGDSVDELDASDGVETDVPGQAFAVPIEGDSMHPEINPGDLAIVRADDVPRIGKIVLVRTVHGDVLCKRYFTKEGGKIVILTSVNQTYHPYELPLDEIVWIYPVKQIIREY